MHFLNICVKNGELENMKRDIGENVLLMVENIFQNGDVTCGFPFLRKHILLNKLN